MTFLFRDLLEINWFAATNVGDQVISTPVLLLKPYSNDWFATRFLCDHKAIANFANILQANIRELFDCDRTIRIIPAKLFRFKLEIFYTKYAKIWCCSMHHKNIHLIKDVPFKRTKMHNISWNVQIPYEGQFVKVLIKLNNF